jgi:methylmalonyl-CoA/ethylmalonyl-CoA epimerase
LGKGRELSVWVKPTKQSFGRKVPVMIEKIDHIGIVVKDLDEAIKAYSEGLGFKVKMVEQSEEFKVKIAFLPVGEVLVELLEPTGPGMIQDFLREHGEGLHHICYRVADINQAMEKIGKTLNLRDKKPRPGGAGSIVAFLDPASIFNVETELVERKEEL